MLKRCVQLISHFALRSVDAVWPGDIIAFWVEQCRAAILGLNGLTTDVGGPSAHRDFYGAHQKLRRVVTLKQVLIIVCVALRQWEGFVDAPLPVEVGHIETRVVAVVAP